MAQNIYYVIESGEYLKPAQEYRQDCICILDEIKKYVNSINGVKFTINLDRLCSVQFKTDPPKGFRKKPDRFGHYIPHARSRYRKEFDALPGFPKIENYLNTIPALTSYGTMSNLKFPRIYWFSFNGPLLLVVQDVREITKGITENGLKRISEHEWACMSLKSGEPK